MAKKKDVPPDPIYPLLDLPADVDKQLCERIAAFSGQGDVLSSALGALIVSRHLGMDGLRVMHSPATLRKYEKALGISYKDYCEKRTPLSRKIFGVRAADKLGGLWKIVTGKTAVKGKRDVSITTE